MIGMSKGNRKDDLSSAAEFIGSSSLKLRKLGKNCF
jgi:hypothetical protein